MSQLNKYKLLLLTVFFLGAAAASAANTLIYKTPLREIHLFDNCSHYLTNDTLSNFVLTEKMSEEIQNILYSQSANKIWRVYLYNNNLILNHSKDYGVTFNGIIANLKFTKPILKHLDFKNNILYLIYTENDKYYYIFSPDYGNSWSQPLQINRGFKVLDSDIFINQDRLSIVLLKDNGKTIYCYESPFIQTRIEPNLPNLKEIRLLARRALPAGRQGGLADPQQNLHLFALCDENNRIYHLKKTNRGWVSNLLFESMIPIYNLKVKLLEETNAFLINFKMDNFAEIENCWAVSQDYGGSLSTPKKILCGDDKILSLYYDEEKLFWVSDKKLTEIQNDPPSVPEIISPLQNTRINSNELNIKLNASDPDQDEILCRIDLCENEYFMNPVSFYVTKEAQINLPFSSGDFFLKAFACDGIAYSTESKPIKITIDCDPPEIIAMELPQNINKNSFNVKFTFSEPVTSPPKFSLSNSKKSFDLTLENLIINSASLEAKLSANQAAEGTYNLKISNLYDLAGNPLKSSPDLIIKIDRQSPMLVINKPKAGDYFSANATILIDTQIEDLQNDLPAKPELNILIDQIPVNGIFNLNENKSKFVGFIPLPKSLLNGRHILEFAIKDLAGNSGRAQTSFSIDTLPPQMASLANPTDEKSKIELPFIENGSGLDIDSSLIKIIYSSKEVEGKFNLIGNMIIFYPKTTLLDGDYTIESTLRDKAGNLSAVQLLTLTIQPYVAKASGEKEKGIAVILQYGPNPYNPEGGSWLLKYTLNGSEVNFYIFTIDGKNIYRSKTTASPISWNGKNQFGEFVPNGVYCFALQSTDTFGNKSLQRGKIIILR